MRLSKKSTLVGGALAVLVLGGAGVAVADIPDSDDGEIHACRVSGDAGNTRIIDKENGASCHAYEDDVTWPTGLSGREIVNHTQSLAYGDTTTISVACPTGKVATGGGFLSPDGSSGTSAVGIHSSKPVDSAGVSRWEARGGNRTGGAVNFTVYAVCVSE